MDSRMSESSGPAQAPVRVQYHDFEALKVDVLSIHDKILQNKGQSSVAAASAPYPANDVEISARPDSQAHHDNSIVLRSRKGLTTSQEALSGGMIPNITPSGISASLETIDSALGEPFSDTDMQKHEPPILQPMLIVKFSTTNPGRINGTERRQAVQYPQQTPTATAGDDTFPSQPRHNAATPLNPSQKRRGRPPGSKNKNLSRRSDIGNGISESQGQLSKAASTKRTRKEHFVAERNESLTQSEIMRAVWAKRRRNGTDGHRGNPPTAKTIQKRQLKNGLPGYSGDMTYGVSHGKDADYRLDRRQRKVLRKYIRKAYAVEVRHARERILVDSAAEPFGFCRAGTDHTQHTSACLPSRTASPTDVPLAIPDRLEQAGHTQTFTPLSVMNAGCRASTGANALLLEAVPDAPEPIGATGLTRLPFATQPADVSNPFNLKCCIACRSRKSKCTLQGTSCLSFKIPSRACSFPPDDLEHNLKIIESGQANTNEMVVQRRASEPQMIRRCTLCCQKHRKCVPQGASCTTCVAGKTTCSFWQHDLEHLPMLASNPNQRLPPPSGPGAIFTRQIKQHGAKSVLQDHRNHIRINPPGSLHNGHGDQLALDLTHPDDSPPHILEPENSGLQIAPSEGLSADLSLPSSRQHSFVDQPENASRAAQISSKKLRGHTHVARADTHIDRGYLEGNSTSQHNDRLNC
ncbi:MAG: hypothetical protein Q9173_005203 [Seirophora scorigena]